MAQFLKKLVLVCGILVLLTLHTLAQGRGIIIFSHDGSQKSGELLSVRESVVSILTKAMKEDEEIAANPEAVEIVLLQDIKHVLLKKTNAEPGRTGILIGGGLGIAAGIIYTANDQSTSKLSVYPINALVGGAMGAIGGLILGRIVELVTAEDEKIIHPSPMQGLTTIREYARFDEHEPQYVRDIIDNLLKEVE